jgi:hypothetical protein
MDEGGGIAELRCTMALAAPRSYTRGFTLPMKILLEPKPGSMASARALALVTPQHTPTLPIRVALIRRMTHNDTYKGRTKEKKQMQTVVAMGNCWVAPGPQQTSAARTVDCEIKLKKDLIPSFEYGGLKVDVSIRFALNSIPFLPKSSQYMVALMAFEPKGLTPMDPVAGEPISTAHMKICANRASRTATPISFIPPGCIEPPISTSARDREEERRLYPEDPLRLHQSLGIYSRRGSLA